MYDKKLKALNAAAERRKKYVSILENDLHRNILNEDYFFSIMERNNINVTKENIVQVIDVAALLMAIPDMSWTDLFQQCMRSLILKENIIIEEIQKDPLFEITFEDDDELLYSRVVDHLKDEILLGELFGKFVLNFEDEYFAKRFCTRVNEQYSLLMSARILTEEDSEIKKGLNIRYNLPYFCPTSPDVVTFAVDRDGIVTRMVSGLDVAAQSGDSSTITTFKA